MTYLQNWESSDRKGRISRAYPGAHQAQDRDQGGSERGPALPRTYLASGGFPGGQGEAGGGQGAWTGGGKGALSDHATMADTATQDLDIHLGELSQFYYHLPFIRGDLETSGFRSFS